MADERAKLAAQVVYDTFCRALDKNDWKYNRHDENLAITCGVRGDDLPMDFVIMADPERYLLSIFSVMSFKVTEDKRVDAALVVNMANYGIANGSFDYDISDGEIRFRLVQSFYHSQLSEDLMFRLLMTAANTVDHYNDKFLAVSTGTMSLEDFIKFEKGDQ